MGLDAYLDDLVGRLIDERPESREAVQKLKIRTARDHEVPKIPKNSRVLNALPEDEREALKPLLVKKPTRSLSGVSVVTVQAPPEACPHGTCTFCPGGPHVGTAQSYTGKEPAARRADRHDFDPYEQAAHRLEGLERNGHPIDKIDLIVQGGTFPARDWETQRSFVVDLFDALNNHDAKEPRRSGSLEEAHERNETAKARGIGLTLETKPDWCRAEHVDRMLALGTTRVEIGVQTVFDEVLEATNRGHTMRDTYRASQIARDAGLKVCYHLMPGLPGSTREMDLETARQTFQDPRLKPDMLKIYPTLVVPGTALHEQHKRGEFEPLGDEEAAERVAEILEMVPPWVRVQRVERDIPTHEIAAGVLKTNLRELAWDEMGRCRCLRCREAPRRTDEPLELDQTRTTYEASGGVEEFLAVEDTGEDAVVGYCRVRVPSQQAHREEVSDAAIVRELKVVGAEVPLSGNGSGASSHQHRGHGRSLMERAERVAEEHGADELLVTAGVGTREYYRKLGYERKGPYMGRALD